jgi:hypothetical protein
MGAEIDCVDPLAPKDSPQRYVEIKMCRNLSTPYAEESFLRYQISSSISVFSPNDFLSDTSFERIGCSHTPLEFRTLFVGHLMAYLMWQVGFEMTMVLSIPSR